MSRLRFANQVVTELCKSLGLAEHALDEQGRLRLSFDDLAVNLVYADDPVELLWFLADLGALDSEDSATLRGLLRVGVVLWAENRMTVGASDSGDRAVGHGCVPVVDLDRVRLEQALLAFVDAAKELRGRLERKDFELDPPAGGVIAGRV